MKHQINDVAVDVDVKLPSEDLIDVLDRVDQTIDKATGAIVTIIVVSTVAHILKKAV